jgi:ribonuclease HI
MAASVWALADGVMVEHMMMNNEPSAKQWLFDMLESLPHDQFTRLTVTLWAIWTARRKAIHEEIFQSPLSTHTFIISYLSELKELGKPTSKSESMKPALSNKGKWIPPPHEVAKINVDGAVAKVANRGAAAAICRDHNGIYLGSSVMIFDGITDPGVLEALACREALALAEDLMLSSIYVASDCKQVVKEIHEGSKGRYGAIISEINHRSSLFQECSFVFESRASNFEAHNLAKHSLALGVGRHTWLGTPHSVTVPVIAVFDE